MRNDGTMIYERNRVHRFQILSLSGTLMQWIHHIHISALENRWLAFHMVQTIQPDISIMLITYSGNIGNETKQAIMLDLKFLY